MTQLKTLQNEFETKRQQFEAILGNADLTDEALSQAETLKGELEGLRQRIARLRDLGEEAQSLKTFATAPLAAPMRFEGQAGTTTVTESGRIVDEDGWSLTPRQLRTIAEPSYKRAFWAYVASKGKVDGYDAKQLSEGLDSEGGFLVPPDDLQALISRRAAPTRLPGLVRQITTSRDRVPFPILNYTSDDTWSNPMRVVWQGEVVSDPATQRPSFSTIEIPIHTGSFSIDITNDLFEDAAFPIDQFVAEQIGTTVGLTSEDLILNGNGILRPAGLLLSPGSSGQPPTQALGTSPGTPTGLSDLVLGLPEQYDGNAVVVMNKTSTYRQLAQLQFDGGTTDRRFLFSDSSDSSTLGSPRSMTLLGYPILFSAMMPSPGASAFPVLFGDLREGYTWVTRLGVSIRYLDQVIAVNNQQRILARLRVGGAVTQPRALRVGQTS